MTLVNKFEQYLVDLLQGHITYDNTAVEVVKHFSEDPQLPLLTLDTGIETTTNQTYRTYYENEELVYIQSSDIIINVWCNTEAQRQSINKQVMDCWYAEQNNHYTYCTHYRNGVCSTTGSTCGATQGDTRRSLSSRCSLLDGEAYESLHYKYDILPSTLNIGSPYDMDELGEHPPLLRSCFRATAAYKDVVPGPDIPVTAFVIDDVEEE